MRRADKSVVAEPPAGRHPGSHTPLSVVFQFQHVEWPAFVKVAC